MFFLPSIRLCSLIQGGKVRQIAVFLLVIESISDHEFVLDVEADIINHDIHRPSVRFIQ